MNISDEDILNFNVELNSKCYCEIMDSFFSKKWNDFNLIILYNRANSEGDIEIEFKDGIIKLHSCILSISSDFFNSALSNNMKERNEKKFKFLNFEKEKILPLFRWIYYKRFDQKNLTIMHIMEIFRFSHIYQIKSIDENKREVYLHQLLEERLSRDFLYTDVSYILNFYSENVEIYRNLKEKIFQNFYETFWNIIELNNRKTHLCSGPFDDDCCIHVKRWESIDDISKEDCESLRCCLHTKAVFFQMAKNLNDEYKNKIFEKMFMEKQ